MSGVQLSRKWSEDVVLAEERSYAGLRQNHQNDLFFDNVICATSVLCRLLPRLRRGDQYPQGPHCWVPCSIRFPVRKYDAGDVTLLAPIVAPVVSPTDDVDMALRQKASSWHFCGLYVPSIPGRGSTSAVKTHSAITRPLRAPWRLEILDAWLHMTNSSPSATTG